MFDPSVIKTFQVAGATYAMIDAAILAEALAGLTPAQQAVVNGYRYMPTKIELEGDPTATPPVPPVIPMWAGNNPPAVYFKITGTQAQQDAKLKAALIKRWTP